MFTGILILLICAAALILLAAFVCYRLVFYNPRPRHRDPEKIDLPEGDIYEPYREQMTGWVKWARSLPQEDIAITSFDGLTLRGKYFEYAPGAPIELMFHGYRGNAERDLSGGVHRCFALGRSILLVDQRSCGASDGHTITFGVYEHWDCLSWLEYAANRFGPEQKIILTGISMGASTVLMAAGQPLPDNVIGVLADCGFTSAPEIIKAVMEHIHLPSRLLYPVVRLGARLFGGFDPDSVSALEAAPNIQVPVIFFHGEADSFVPCYMSRKNYDACTCRKRLVTVPGAGHGLAFPVDPENYLQHLRDFFGSEASAQ